MNMLLVADLMGAWAYQKEPEPPLLLSPQLTLHPVHCSDLPTLASNSPILKASWAASGIWPWADAWPKPGWELLTLTELCQKCGFTLLILLVLQLPSMIPRVHIITLTFHKRKVKPKEEGPSHRYSGAPCRAGE